MNAEQFFNQKSIVDLSFFNFRNAITAAYFANKDFEILRTNDNFRAFFPLLGNVSKASMLNVLEQLGVPGVQIDTYRTELLENGSVLLPKVEISANGEDRIYSLLSTFTQDADFSYLNGIQGQFVDRTTEWSLRKEREELLEQKLRDRELIEAKSQELQNLATRLAKYLSPQIYKSIFSESEDTSHVHKRKTLNIFFSDIVQFTDLSDTLEPERLADIVNSYLSEMTNIALECGGTIDKFIGDAIMVFFGDPETEGEAEDALRCVEMAVRMQERVAQLQSHWRKKGVTNGLKVRMGIATGFCTVGNFGSDQRLDYTVLGSPVNLASRLQSVAEPNKIVVDENTYNLVETVVSADLAGEFQPRGFARPVRYYELKSLAQEARHEVQKQLSHIGKHVEVMLYDSGDIRGAIEELREIQNKFETLLAKNEKDGTPHK